MHPSFRLYPVLLGLSGGNQKLAPTELKQLLADYPRQPCVARRGRWGPENQWAPRWLDYPTVQIVTLWVWRDKSHSSRWVAETK